MGKSGWATTGLAILIPLVSIAWGIDLYRSLGLNLFGEQVLSLILALVLPLVFLRYPARGSASGQRDKIPFYDVIAALLGFSCALYVAFEYPRIFEELYTRPLDATIIGAVLLLLVVEGLRRTAGTFLALVVLFFLVFALFGHFVLKQATIYYVLIWKPPEGVFFCCTKPQRFAFSLPVKAA